MSLTILQYSINILFDAIKIRIGDASCWLAEFSSRDKELHNSCVRALKDMSRSIRDPNVDVYVNIFDVD